LKSISLCNFVHKKTMLTSCPVPSVQLLSFMIALDVRENRSAYYPSQHAEQVSQMPDDRFIQKK